MKKEDDVRLFEAKSIPSATPVSKNRSDLRGAKTAREAFCMTGDSQSEIF